MKTIIKDDGLPPLYKPDDRTFTIDELREVLAAHPTVTYINWGFTDSGGFDSSINTDGFVVLEPPGQTPILLIRMRGHCPFSARPDVVLRRVKNKRLDETGTVTKKRILNLDLPGTTRIVLGFRSAFSRQGGFQLAPVNFVSLGVYTGWKRKPEYMELANEDVPKDGYDVTHRVEEDELCLHSSCKGHITEEPCPIEGL